MLIRFFFALRAAGLRASVTELLALLGALKARVAAPSLDEFYVLARTCLVKDETRYDLYDRAFAQYFDGVSRVAPELAADIPAEWLRKQAELLLTDEEKAQVRKLGGLEAILRALQERLREQRERHEGGNRFIGTGGRSPFGAYGYNPEGVRIGGPGGQRSAVKVWEQRQFRALDDKTQIGTRNLALALRKLRRFAREGAAEELDLDSTIEGTARNAGWLDLKFRPERHNAVKVLLFLDIGGTMDAHVRVCEELFSAARSEFKHLEHFYFHNCVYERVWREENRRYQQWTPTLDLMHRYPPDYRVIFVGDAAMSPYEITEPGGSIEHWNEEPGETWLTRITSVFPKCAWLNPLDESTWDYTPSIGIVRELLKGRMYPLTMDGLSRAIDVLRR